MGRSFTIHCVGFGKKYAYTAMNRIDVAQAIAKAKKQGDEIEYWIAQTKTGMRILKTDFIGQEKYTKDLKLPKLVRCAVCDGTGILSANNEVRHPCPVCKGSGISNKSALKNWSAWQIKDMLKERREYQNKLKREAL